jgi:hypothetical protein
LLSLLVFLFVLLKNLVLVTVSVLIPALVHLHVMLHTLVWACSNFQKDMFFQAWTYPISRIYSSLIDKIFLHFLFCNFFFLII